MQIKDSRSYSHSKLKALWSENLLAWEIGIVLVFKLVIVIAIKSAWFDDPVARPAAHVGVVEMFSSSGRSASSSASLDDKAQEAKPLNATLQ